MRESKKSEGGLLKPPPPGSYRVNPIRSGGGGALKAPPPIFCSHAFNFGAALLCVGDFSQKIVFLMGGHDLAVRGVSKYKVDMIFIIFREFNTMLEIVDS